MVDFREQGSRRDARLWLRFGAILLIGILLLAACQAKTPAPTSSEFGATPASSATATGHPSAQPAATNQPSGRPTQAISKAATQPVPSAYPGPQGRPLPTSASAYPGPAGSLLPTPAGAYPAPGSGTIQTPGSVGPYPDPANNASSAYPTPLGQSGTSLNSPYPSPNASAYPGPATQPAVTNQPAATTQPAATNQPAATTQPGPSSTPTMTPLPSPSGGPTPTPTAPPTASPTATLPPTAAMTPTATTAPSLRTDLLATDPSTVQLASGKPELVVFFAYWDGNSRIMMPVLLSLQDQFGSQINFIYLDSDDPATAQLKRDLYYEPYGIKPQIFLLDAQGKVLRKWKGVVTQLELQQAIQAASGS